MYRTTLDRPRAAACLAGILTASLLWLPFWLASPAASFVAYVALTPLAWTALKLGPGASAVAAAIGASAFHGYALLAFWPATPTMAVAGPVLQASVWAGTLSCGAWLARSVDAPSHRPLVLGLAAFVLEHALDRAGWPLFPMTVGIAGSQWSSMPVAVFGVPALDGFALAAGGAIACRLPRSLFVAILFWSATCGLATLTEDRAGRPATVHLIQPRVGTQDFHATGWSLATRSSVQEHFDQLTRRAALRERGLIIWPEGGTSVADLQTLNRRRTLSRAVGDSRSDLLVATTIVSADHRYSGVATVREGRVTDWTSKQRLVPFAEGDLHRGPFRILETTYGRLGILVCFDGIFGTLARALRNQGAEALVLVTDDSSFGRSSAVDVHLATALLAARSVRLPLVVASNSGPSLVMDGNGRVSARSRYDEEIVLSAEATLVSRPARLVPAVPDALTLVSLGFLAMGISRRRSHRDDSAEKQDWSAAPVGKERTATPSRFARITRAGAVLFAMSTAMLFGAAADVLRAATLTGAPVAWVLKQFALRAGSAAVAEGIGPAFKQRTRESCGAAALAFALTHLGEVTTEEALVHRCRLPDRALSLEDIAVCSRHEGALATGIEGSWEWLVARNGRPVILHTRDHFVTVVKATPEHALVFDPARGQVLVQSRAELSARWTRRAIALDLASPLGQL